jgi:hypothetical protein
MERKSKKSKRLLPGDYQKKIKYNALDDTTKDVQSPDGFFNFPETLKGNQQQNEREFLVFYFDDKKQYKAVREYFEIKTTSHVSHPYLDSKKLFGLIK